MKGRAYKDYYPGFGENEIFFSAMEWQDCSVNPLMANNMPNNAPSSSLRTGAAADRVLISVEEYVEVWVLILQLLDPLKNLCQAEIGGLVEQHLDFLVHRYSPCQCRILLLGYDILEPYHG
jgi:hypothetical protein